MTAREFFNLVSEMRDAQKRYFRMRTSDNLQQSKRLEKEVDSEITRVRRILDERAKEPDLFG